MLSFQWPSVSVETFQPTSVAGMSENEPTTATTPSPPTPATVSEREEWAAWLQEAEAARATALAAVSRAREACTTAEAEALLQRVRFVAPSRGRVGLKRRRRWLRVCVRASVCVYDAW
eukprot:COSAG01_NODE_113_length_25617_cov_10.523492_13_plen_118_part_00